MLTPPPSPPVQPRHDQIYYNGRLYELDHYNRTVAIMAQPPLEQLKFVVTCREMEFFLFKQFMVTGLAKIFPVVEISKAVQALDNARRLGIARVNAVFPPAG